MKKVFGIMCFLFVLVLYGYGESDLQEWGKTFDEIFTNNKLSIRKDADKDTKQVYRIISALHHSDESILEESKLFESPTVTKLIVSYYEFAMRKKSFWEAVDLPYLEKIAEKLNDDLSMQVVKDILFFLRDKKDASSPIKLPKPLDIQSLETRFFCGIYLCCILKNKDASWRYFNSSFSKEMIDSIVLKYKDLLNAVYPGAFQRLTEYLEFNKKLFKLKTDIYNKQYHSMLLNATKQKNPYAFLAVGVYYYSEKEYERAKKCFLIAAHEIPGIAFDFFELFDKISDRETAKKLLHIAIDDGGNNPHQFLAILLANSPQTYSEAEEIARAGLARGDRYNRFIIAYLMMKQNEPLAEIEKLLGEISPDEKATYMVNWYLSMIYKHYNHLDKALEYIRAADGIYNYKDPRPKNELFQILLLQKKYKEASKVMTDIYNLDSNKIDLDARRQELEQAIKDQNIKNVE